MRGCCEPPDERAAPVGWVAASAASKAHGEGYPVRPTGNVVPWALHPSGAATHPTKPGFYGVGRGEQREQGRRATPTLRHDPVRPSDPGAMLAARALDRKPSLFGACIRPAGWVYSPAVQP